MKADLEQLDLTIASDVVERALYTVVICLYAAGYVSSFMALV